MIIRSLEVRILVDRNLVKTSFEEWATLCHFSRTGLQAPKPKTRGNGVFGTDQANIFHWFIQFDCQIKKVYKS